MQFPGKLSVLALLIASGSVQAAGTLVSEMSKLNVSTAGAGSAALAENATTAYSNPAAMSYLDGRHFSANAGVMALDVEYQDNRTSALDSDNAGGIQPYGSLYWVEQVCESVRWGASLVSTGGSALDYGDRYAGAAGLNDLRLAVLQFNPSLSYQVSPALSLGAGVQIDRATFEQTSLFGNASLETDSVAFGYNLGMTYQLNEANRLGITYRSSMKHDLSGQFQLAPGMTGDVGLNIVNPAQVEISGLHQLTAPLSVVWSVGHEDWSENDVTYVDVNGSTVAAKARDFDDVWFASVGARYQLAEDLRLEAGVGYASSPLDDATKQSADLPVDAQRRYSVGATYQWSDNVSLNGYYSHVDYGSPEIDSGKLNGRFNNSNQFVGMTLNIAF